MNIRPYIEYAKAEFYALYDDTTDAITDFDLTERDKLLHILMLQIVAGATIFAGLRFEWHPVWVYAILVGLAYAVCWEWGWDMYRKWKGHHHLRNSRVEMIRDILAGMVGAASIVTYTWFLV